LGERRTCPGGNSRGQDSPAAQRLAAIRAGQVVGALYLPGWPDRGVEESIVDLTVPSTVDRHVITARLASLSEESRTTLRFALARAGALRTPELGFHLEDIVGDRIDGATIVASNPLEVELTLRAAGPIRLLQQPGGPSPGGPARTAESAP
jgi:hypothetical protein